LMGSSAVGKSTASRTLMEEYGIHNVEDGHGGMVADAVQIDGEIFRRVHKGFQDIVQAGLMQSPPCIWRGAWKKTQARTQSKVYKKKVYKTALEAKKNLIIPSPCASDIEGCLKRMKELKEAGYTNHVVAIYARDKLVEERGRSRADFDGKMYVSVKDDAVYAFAPMIVMANGNWQLVNNTGTPQTGPSGKGLDLDMLSDGVIEEEAPSGKVIQPPRDSISISRVAMEQELNQILLPMFDLGISRPPAGKASKDDRRLVSRPGEASGDDIDVDDKE